jgi:hypothetical protein
LRYTYVSYRIPKDVYLKQLGNAEPLLCERNGAWNFYIARLCWAMADINFSIFYTNHYQGCLIDEGIEESCASICAGFHHMKAALALDTENIEFLIWMSKYYAAYLDQLYQQHADGGDAALKRMQTLTEFNV